MRGSHDPAPSPTGGLHSPSLPCNLVRAEVIEQETLGPPCAIKISLCAGLTTPHHRRPEVSTPRHNPATPCEQR